MNRNPDPTDRPAALPLAELFTRYLGRQAEAQALGLGHPDLAGEVEPYEAVPVQPMEPRLAWADAVAVAGHFADAKAEWPVPPEWPALVAAQEPAVAVPFCLGNFPQLVRDLQPLFAGRAPDVPAKPARPLPAGGLTAWAERQKNYPLALLAGGVLRLAQHFDPAEVALGKADAVPPAWRAVHANETAALAWHRGQHTEALALWRAQPTSVPVLFNRGMALLFLGRSEDAREPLSQAVAGLKETNAWHHLGQLYLTLAKVTA
jgi:tetratricopeptide (TPR) repeat protein